MDTSRIGWLVTALACLAWIPTWIQLDMTFYALTTVGMSIGMVLCGFGRLRSGLALAAIMLATWLVGFTLDGFEFGSILTAGIMSAGLAYAAFASRPRSIAIGLALAWIAQLWYLIHNTFLASGTPGFALGNWIFAAGFGLVTWNAFRASVGSEVVLAAAA